MKSKKEQKLSVNSANYEALTDNEREVILVAKIMVDRFAKNRRHWTDGERMLVAAVGALGTRYFQVDE